MPGQRAEQAPVRVAVGAKTSRCLRDIPPDDRGPRAVQGVGVLRAAGGETDAAADQVEAAEERRCQSERVNSRAVVMTEARQGQLTRTAAAADGRGPLDHQDPLAGRR